MYSFENNEEELAIKIHTFSPRFAERTVLIANEYIVDDGRLRVRFYSEERNLNEPKNYLYS